MIDKHINNIEELSASIGSDVKALLILLEDMHDSAPPYRLHAAIVLTRHLEELSETLMNTSAWTHKTSL